MSEDIKFVEKYFQNLINRHISYCILRNAEEVENGDAHDIDMSVDAKYLVEAEKTMLETADSMGWRMHLKTGSSKDTMNIKSYHFYKIIEDGLTIKIVHFDIFPTFAWDGYVLLDNSTLLEDIDESNIYHKAGATIEAVTKLFVRLLHNGYIKPKYKQYISEQFSANPKGIKKVLDKFLDSCTSDYVLHTVKNRNWIDLEKNRRKLISSIHNTAKNKARFVHNHFTQKVYLMKKAVSKAGIMIAFEGTDGSGKSTIINGLPEILGNTFPESFIDYYHWRPGFIKKGKQSEDGVSGVCTEPHAKKPYGRIISFAKFMFFNLDYILGYWCKVRWQLSKGHLVVFDRYYYDYYLDKIRYRLSISDRTLNIFKYFIPKPDITFLLVGDAKTLYERKREIPVEEIQEQIDRLLKHQNDFHNSIIVDVNQPVKKVVYDVSVEILKFCSENVDIKNKK